MATDPNQARLFAAAQTVANAVDALDRDESRMGQGYHLERLVKQARTLKTVVDALAQREDNQKGGGPSGLPPGPA